MLQNTAVVGKEGESFEEFRPEGRGAETAKTEEKNEAPAPEAEKETTAEEASLSEKVSPVEQRSVEGEESRIRISPRAGKLAREKRVSIRSVTGSGPGGRIIERDILEAVRSGNRLTPLAQRKMEKEGLAVPGEGRSPHKRITSRDLLEAGAAAEKPVPSVSGEPYTDTPLGKIRKIVAEGMFRSLQNSAQLTHHLSANASKMLQMRKIVKQKVEEGYSYNITLNDMVCYSVIRALQQFPDANAHFMGDSIRKFHRINLGIAVDTERGLMVPALLHADDYSLPGLSSQLRALTEEARKGSISPDLLAPEAASFTVSNLGNYGVEMFTPVINLPQVAILGVNTIIHRPAILEDGNFGFQPFIGLSLTYDHRALDGGPATIFLAAIKTEIENLSADLIAE